MDTQNSLMKVFPLQNTSFSNQVLRMQTDKKILYILPAYLRMTVRKIQHIELESSSAEISGTLIFSVYYEGLPEDAKMIRTRKSREGNDEDYESWYIQQLSNKMAITLNSQSEYLFASKSDMFLQRALRINHDEQNHLFSYIVRDKFQAQVDGNIVLTPFQTLNVYIQFSLRTIQCDWKQNGKKVELRFNFMDTQENDKLLMKLRFDAGQYAVAQKMCSLVFISTQQDYNKKNPNVHQNIRIQQNLLQISEKQKMTENNTHRKKKKLVYFQHGHAKIVLYKHPFTTIFSVMIPMWILALLVQISFFQDNQLGGRIASVAIALVAYMAFIPSVRQKIPPSPEFTYLQMVIFCLLTTSMLCILRGFLDAGIEDYFYQWKSDPLFIISLILNFATVASTFILVIIFYTFLKAKYTGAQNRKPQHFDRTKWFNIKADRMFKDILEPVQKPEAIEAQTII